MSTIRPFDWRDVALLHRLRNRGLCLDSQQAYIRGPQALTNALLGAFSPIGGTCTLVARPTSQGELPAVGQVLQHNGESLSRVMFLGPEEALSQSSGLDLLEALCQAAGARGARNLIAEVNEDSLTFESLRRSGFAIYARQSIWRLLQPLQSQFASAGRSSHKARRSVSGSSSQAPEVKAAAHDIGETSVKDASDAGQDILPERVSQPQSLESMWRPESASDAPAIHLLYLNLVPVLVQQVEPLPSRGGHGLVHWQEGELLGYIDIEQGPRGIWAQPYFHPAAEEPEELLMGFLQRLKDGRNRPLYVCARSYQGWMKGPLDSLGFELCHSQAVMVKRLAATVREPALAPLHVLEGTRPEPTTPFAHLEKEIPTPRTGRRV